MDNLKIRFAKIDDYFYCRKLDLRINKVKFQQMVTHKESLVAILDSKIIGYIRLERVWLRIPYLSWILIDEKFRGQGVATKMLSKLISHLKSKNEKFLLSSFQDNAEASKKWHNQLGFKRCGKVSNLNEDGSCELFCQLML